MSSPEMAANFERIFDAAYEMGYAWATVHCRTVEQKYLGPGRWEFLRDLVRRRPDRVIFGSGDVWTVLDIFRMIDMCGVHGVSVARGCIGNPWIFRQAREMMAGRAPIGPSIADQRALLSGCGCAYSQFAVAVADVPRVCMDVARISCAHTAQAPRAQHDCGVVLITSITNQCWTDTHTHENPRPTNVG